MLDSLLGISSGNLEIVRNSSHSLLLRRSKIGAFFGLMLSIAAVIAFYIAYLTTDEANKTFNFLAFIAVVAFSASSIYLSVYAIVKGETYKFQKKRCKLYKNQKKWFNFKELIGVEIKHKYDSEHDSYDYDLSLIAIGNHKYKLDESGDLEAMKFLAEEIASVLDVNVSHQV